MVHGRRILALVLPAFASSVDGFLLLRSSIQRNALVSLRVSDNYGEETPASSKRRRRPPRIRPVRPSKISSAAESSRSEARARHQHALNDPSLLTKMTFAGRSDIHPALKRGITEVLGLQAMTQIQAKTYEKALAGESILGRSRTGTGKTLAFLLPVIERLLEFDYDLYRPGRNIGIIIVAPTRELAIQIADQAKSLTTYLNDFEVGCVYGGTRMQRDLRLLSPRVPSLLVATPGRLLEHLDKTRVDRRKFCDIVDGTKIVVFDEADRLFESFPQETKKILSFLPRAEKRQTLLFSATMPSKLKSFLKKAMKIDYVQIDCVDDGGSASETNALAEQFYCQLETMDDYIAKLIGIIQHETKCDSSFKIIVFFPAGRLVKFFAQFFNIGLGIPVLEIHSRMSQASRNRASGTFREARKGILFTSDVSARGVDYPDVSLVVQYGAPSSKDSYIHRLGRTARAGRAGKGLLVLLPFESYWLTDVRQLNIAPDIAEEVHSLDESMIDQLEAARLKVRSGHAVLTPSAEAAYKSFLAHYINSGQNAPSVMLKYGNQLAACTGLSSIPAFEAKIASRLGLEGLAKEC